ncbi:MAG: glycoside hydrolase family 3 N-terminal domain-containing protein [Actinomycetota bacterium]|nr:glycoside hydrolase family 3 N-terminal domain-containing protein [Actinomycetota bacterium]
MRPRALRLRAAVLAAVALAACSSTRSNSVAVTTSIATSTPATAPASTTTLPLASTTTLAPVDELQPFAACVQNWPLRDRIALLVWPAAYSGRWAAVQAAVRDLHVGGVIVMTPEAAALGTLAADLAALDALSPHGLLVATDEEGGAVQRLRALGVLASQESMSTMALADARAVVEQHARLVAGVGIDVVFGPVADVRPELGDDPLGDGRLFLGDPENVATWAQMYVAAWQSAGIMPVLKHFPGHGSASADSHDQLAVTPPVAALRARDFVPYVLLADSGAGAMVGHLAVPDLTGGEPASRSAAAVAVLRDELGWGDALLFTDGLGMNGVGLPEQQAAVLAVQAGIDVVIFTEIGATGEVIAALAAAVANGSLPEARVNESAARVARQLAAHGHPCV